MAGKKGRAALSVVGSHGSIGHNSGELTSDQQQVLFHQHMKKIKAAKEQMATATSQLRNAYKLAKSEGFPKTDIDYAFMLEKDKDDGAIQARRREAEIAKWMGHPIGTQPDLFATGVNADPRSQGEKAYEDGKRAGIRGEVCKAPYGPGTDGYDGYMRGWHDGNAALSNQAKEQEEGDAVLMRRPENQPAVADDFDEASDGDAGEWPDDVATEARSEETTPDEQPEAAL